ncbi:SPFH domain-containing protein [Methylomonas sp. SURF-2]|uniref:SPFH domain-containing protein n=1 Tax=Methylomonas subterranea TaxID=2952225 RepID=A0ABT1TEY3_9GAMM|nr:SPFH domain-containing protein [Methylomonas sp. SURF-2]MCQ8104021.1 SPFH domain-containing protein [Methylomonas sp. SURF-2]
MEIIITITAVASVILIGALIVFASMYRKVDQGQAMIVNTLSSEPKVTFTGSLVIPVLHRVEKMAISLKTVEINRRGGEGLICKDNIRADIVVTFFVRVNKTREDVLKVAQAIGCERASDQKTIEELFNAKFSEALKTVGKRMDFEDLYRERNHFRDQIIQVIGQDLNGYVLEDAAIDYLEQTPMNQLDANNILDAQGIRKITELTAIQHVRTNELQRDEQMQIKKKDVETQEKLLELERQQADAESKQKREIATVQAREKAETEKVVAEEHTKEQRARIVAEQTIGIDNENKQREIEVAEKNRERAIAIETEKVERVRQLEIIDREKEVELQRIAKEKALEEQKKEIAEVIRARIAVEKHVAEEEERIKELREVSEADRKRQAIVIAAEAEAQESLVKDIKAAEAAEQSAQFKAKETLVLAGAEFEAAEKQAQAKIRLAEGIQAEQAAQGLAEAKVLRERMAAQAQGDEAVGMAQVRIKNADADSEEKQAMVAVKVKIAEAEAIERRGQAEAEAVRQHYQAEADGLKSKFAAMASMDEKTRSHEEFRLRVDTAHSETMAGIEAAREAATLNAGVFGEAVKQANIDIVGGDGEFFDRYMKALSVGKAIDGAVYKSDLLKATFEDHLSGKANLLDDVKQIAANLGSDDLQNLSVSAFLNKLMQQGSSEDKAKIRALLEQLSR